MTIMFTDFAWSGGNYEDRFIIYDGITIGSNDGMLVIRVTGIYGTISPLTLTADDVNVDTSEDKMTKVYDGTSDVEVSFAFGERLAQAVTGFGDGSEVGMTIAANTSGKDVGRYAVNISDVRVASGNYVLTEDFAAALAAKSTVPRLTVNLSKSRPASSPSPSTSPMPCITVRVICRARAGLR